MYRKTNPLRLCAVLAVAIIGTMGSATRSFAVGFLQSGRGLQPPSSCVLQDKVAPSERTAAGDPNPGVVWPPGSSPYGASYGEWSGLWWNWAVGQPFNSDPITDPDGSRCDVGQSGLVWFLAGTFGTTTTRSCTVPSGQAIFFPIANIYVNHPCACPACATPGLPPDQVEPCLRSFAEDYMNDITTLEVEVDGVPLSGLFDYRAPSGLFTLTPHVSWQAADPCVTGDPQPAVSDGWWIMLYPLSDGPHTLHFRAAGLISVTDPACTFEFQFEVNVTYNLMVSPSVGVEQATWGTVKELFR